LRFFRKNPLTNAEHSSAKTPPFTSIRWFNNL